MFPDSPYFPHVFPRHQGGPTPVPGPGPVTFIGKKGPEILDSDFLCYVFGLIMGFYGILTGFFWWFHCCVFIDWIDLRENLNRKPWIFPWRSWGFPINFPIIQFYDLCSVFWVNGILWDYLIFLMMIFIVMSFDGNRWIGFTHGNVNFFPENPIEEKVKRWK